MEKLLSSQSLPARLIVSDASFATILRADNRPVRIGPYCVTSDQEVQAVFYDRMVASRNCFPLADLLQSDGKRLVV